MEFSKGLPDTGHHISGINLLVLCMLLRVRQSPPMTGGTCMCLSVVLLVNNYQYWLARSEKYNVHCKT